MTTKTTFIATAPDGTRFTRTSATREYTSAVLAFSNGTWGEISFNGRQDLAVKEAAKWTARFGLDQVIVVPVEKRAWTRPLTEHELSDLVNTIISFRELRKNCRILSTLRKELKEQV
jgi:hypothetical protein